ncbi:MAG: fibronectin type III domain-containing protein [Deltaproteobacteria bacterium]|nr:fibronectin type III domain-containing protein [Deltaproteobacteria bacterium]
MRKKHHCLTGCLFALLAILFVMPGPYAYAENATLVCDPNSDPDLAGYRVYIGYESRSYSCSVDTGMETSYSLSNLEPEKTYYLAVTAYNIQGAESIYSEELVYKTPPGTPINSKLVVGLGSFLENGGWLQAISLRDYLHDSWLRVDWDEYNLANGESRLAKGDIDGDGKEEIIIGLAPVPEDPSIPNGIFEVLDDDYTHLAWGQIDWADYNAVNGETWPACGDVDGDQKDEIIIGLGPGGNGVLEVFDYTPGRLIHKTWIEVDWEDYNLACGESRPASGDIDGDGKEEIVIGLGPVPEDPSIPNGIFEVLDDDCTHLAWGQIDWADYNAVNGETRPACGDVDGDQKDEIIIGLGTGGEGRFETHVYQGNQVVYSEGNQVNWQEYNALFGETRPVCGDIDSDKKDEILIGLGKGGEGIIQVFDDALEGYKYLTSLQTGFQDYDIANGETWPVVIMLNRVSGVNPVPWLRLLLLEN